MNFKNGVLESRQNYLSPLNLEEAFPNENRKKQVRVQIS